MWKWHFSEALWGKEILFSCGVHLYVVLVVLVRFQRYKYALFLCGILFLPYVSFHSLAYK